MREPATGAVQGGDDLVVRQALEILPQPEAVSHAEPPRVTVDDRDLVDTQDRPPLEVRRPRPDPPGPDMPHGKRKGDKGGTDVDLHDQDRSSPAPARPVHEAAEEGHHDRQRQPQRGKRRLQAPATESSAAHNRLPRRHHDDGDPHRSVHDRRPTGPTRTDSPHHNPTSERPHDQYEECQVGAPAGHAPMTARHARKRVSEPRPSSGNAMLWPAEPSWWRGVTVVSGPSLSADIGTPGDRYTTLP
ncbi:MAG: hypothetical protein LC799_05465 [Actinobacteria bacterium]|nr:hypothetical protein [Actinomycetota bacterium]